MRLEHFFAEGHEVQAAVCIAVDRCFSAARLVRISRQHPTARSYVSYGDKRMSGNATKMARNSTE